MGPMSERPNVRLYGSRHRAYSRHSCDEHDTTLLLYYLKKDRGLMEETAQFQAQMAELIHEIYILIIRDAERRMDKVMEAAVLDHETIPGFEDIHFQN